MANNAFFEGFGSVLSLSPPDRKLEFTYEGRDIGKVTAIDALSQDWNLVAAYLAAAIQSEQQHQHESDGE